MTLGLRQVYWDTTTNQNGPYGQLSVEATSILKDKILTRQTLLREKRWEIQRQYIPDSYQEISKEYWEIFKFLRDSVVDNENPLCDQKTSFSPYALPCGYELYDPPEVYYLISRLAQDLKAMSQQPQNIDWYLASLQEKRKLLKELSTRFYDPNNFSYSSFGHSLNCFAYELNNPYAGLLWQKQYLKMVDEELIQIEPIAAELAMAGDQWRFLQPQIIANDFINIIFEGKSLFPSIIPKPLEMSLVNASAYLEYWDKTNAFQFPYPLTPSELQSQQIDIGLGKPILIEANSNQNLETVIQRLSLAIDTITNIPVKREAYLSSVGEKVDKVKIVTEEEMRVLWLESLKRQAEEAKSLLFEYPDKARKIIVSIAYALKIIPDGLYYSNGTIYIQEKADLKKVFSHELAHAAHASFSAHGIIKSPLLDQVDKELFKQMTPNSDSFDDNKISDHYYVTSGIEAGSNEWRTDTLVEYWTNPFHLKEVDPQLYYFYFLLHHQTEKHNTAWEKKETKIPGALKYGMYYYVATPINPFEAEKPEERLKFAVEYFNKHKVDYENRDFILAPK